VNVSVAVPPGAVPVVASGVMAPANAGSGASNVAGQLSWASSIPRLCGWDGSAFVN
jgi:hypothetical protein